MKRAGKLEITTPTDREVVMTRAFAAPRALVWEAYTRPEHVRRWLGVHSGWTFEVCEMDFRVGGRYRWVWRSPTGDEMGMGGVYCEIVPGVRVVATEKFDQSWYEGEAVVTAELREQGGITTLTLAVLYDSREIRDAVLRTPMESGVAGGFDTLELLLPTIAAG